MQVHQLPPQIRVLVQVIGLRATLALLQARGGTPYTVPIDGGRSRVLCEIIGAHAAEKLSARFKQRTLSLPKLDKAVKQIRDRRIRQDHAQGVSLSELAFRYRLTTRHISNIVQQQREDHRQAELFAS